MDFMHPQPSRPPHSQPPPLQPPLTLYCAVVRDLPQAPSSTIINQTGGREPDRRVGVECTTGPDGGGEWGSRSPTMGWEQKFSDSKGVFIFKDAADHQFD